MNKPIQLCALIAVIALSTGWAGLNLCGNRSLRPVAGLIHRSKVDRSGHTRGIVQVDLMRRIMAEQARLGPPAIVAGIKTDHRVPSQDHPLLDHPAPALVLKDVWGKTWDLSAEVRDGPVVIVFYLGSTCMACVTHLTELDVAISRFRVRGVRVLGVSGDTPEFSLERIRKYGNFQIPLLSDAGRAPSSAYGVWKAVPSGGEDGGEARHGTFIVDRDGLVRWAFVGNRPFTDIEALLTELDGLRAASLW
jgi:mycoredoxin-dependent peroxiredoxin